MATGNKTWWIKVLRNMEVKRDVVYRHHQWERRKTSGKSPIEKYKPPRTNKSNANIQRSNWSYRDALIPGKPLHQPQDSMEQEQGEQWQTQTYCHRMRQYSGNGQGPPPRGYPNPHVPQERPNRRNPTILHGSRQRNRTPARYMYHYKQDMDARQTAKPPPSLGRDGCRNHYR